MSSAVESDIPGHAKEVLPPSDLQKTSSLPAAESSKSHTGTSSSDTPNLRVKRPISPGEANGEGNKTARLDDDDLSNLSHAIKSSKYVKNPSSVYKETALEVPAWMKSKLQNDGAHKYDKYGQRATHDDPYAKYSKHTLAADAPKPQLSNQDRYAKYGAPARPATDTRVIRREPEPEIKRKDILPADEVADPGVEVAAYTSVPSVSGPGMNADYRTFQSNIAHKENKDINSIVRQHYNQRTYQSKLQGSRTKSPIYKMRNFNNAIKYMLIGNWVKRRAPQAPLVILDMCCGKGGDLNKCEFASVDHYVGIDISDASVREAYSRYSQNKARFIPQNPQSKRSRDSRRYNFEACFATGDLFTYSVPEILEKNFPGIIEGLFPVDAVSMQFSFHYAWESESKVRQVLTNITRSLRPGGTFIGTIPSSDFIRNKIIEKKWIADRTFGNDLYHVKFEQEPPEDGVFRSPYGNRYDYFLKDAVDDVPEYVVPFETLRLLCEDYGLILKYRKNFSEIFSLEIPKYFSKLNKNLIEGMKRADGKYGVEGDEKEAVAFYIGFVFEKVGA
ncbi:guanine-N(7)-methyltransferase [Metschnikowia bicuspidata var. bicuspidata NRRL YB-4993]|uniref:mRNA cap guanine-N(7) methyltransferase n=1 Tax=Metschnikowia bicuspidata var. bicuspidata NRRL YB-4993 TaxID=869754 RepID=A0A1A0HCL1_9ASCO|nr:guanine-N(7)-methyltransferase [Metschnikowia bicuspidata var. bicuspidata NRRL YB-4993]OBA21844.1 guanine-N(7)-methyltransferase [Metschnikowia bicuspidata var. bicuspidata NRRL YB-4993]